MSDDETFKTEVHRMVVMIVDHDELGAKRASEELENGRFGNRCISPNVLHVDTVEVDWNDDHPLNNTKTQEEAFKALFESKAQVSDNVAQSNTPPDEAHCTGDFEFRLPDLKLFEWALNQMRRAARTLDLCAVGAKPAAFYAQGLDACADAVEQRLSTSKQRTHRFVPFWRAQLKDNDQFFPDKQVEVVSHPSPEWTTKLHTEDDGCQSIRFALMANGELYFGDAWTVVHRDMMQLRDPDEAAPILIGVVAKRKGWPSATQAYSDRLDWRVLIVQYFMSGKNNMKMARRLLECLPAWSEFVVALGQDPFILATDDHNSE